METEGKIKLDRNKSCEDVTWDKISHYAQWQDSVSVVQSLWVLSPDFRSMFSSVLLNGNTLTYNSAPEP